MLYLLSADWLRYDYGQYTWRAGSSQMLDKKNMRLASNLFHVGIIGIFAGHFLGMLTPHWMYESFLPIEYKQIMAMVGGYLWCVNASGRCDVIKTPFN